MRMQIQLAEMSCRHSETGLSLRDSVRSLVLREGFRIEQLYIVWTYAVGLEEDASFYVKLYIQPHILKYVH